MIKKTKIVSVVTILLLIAEVCRFFHISIIKGKEYESAAYRQRVAGTKLDPQRGNIYDRNMIPLTNRNEKLITYTMPNSSIYNIYTTQRYDTDSVGRYITGYVRKDGIGETGIEGKYEEYIKATGQRQIVVIRDAVNNPLQGFGYTITDIEEKPYEVKLTVDYNYQKICEDVFEKNGVSGAFVLQDTSNGDILAMGSYPEYEHGNIAEYLESEKGELTNRATSAYSLGSVYKMVVAACALEEDYDFEYSFYCTGAIDVDGQDFKCHTHAKGGHGIISLKNAFAQSCNPYFIDLGLELGMEKLVNAGKLFGFGEKSGIYLHGINESNGNLPDINGIIYNRAIANTAIGQGEILVTPLQVTNAVTAVANGGMLLKPNIVDCIIDGTGKKVQQIKFEESNRIIKESTAQKLTELMEEVSISGTAKEGTSAYGLSGIYGKTGSAETGIYTENNEQIVHSWFSAFFDCGESKYTLTVFLENGVTLEQSSVRIFSEIVADIKK